MHKKILGFIAIALTYILTISDIHFISRLVKLLYQPDHWNKLLCLNIYPDSAQVAIISAGLLSILVAVIFQPIIEECFFRHLLINFARKYVNKWLALLFSSIVFVAAHSQIWKSPISYSSVLLIFFVGLIAGLFYLLRDSIIDSSLIHIGSNAIILIPKNFDPNPCAQLSDSSIISLLLTAILIISVMYAYLNRVLKKTNSTS